MRIDLAPRDALSVVTHQDLAAPMPTVTWSAWSCAVRLVVSDAAVLDAATEDLMGLMRRVDSAASRFRNDSDLNWANLNHGRPIAVSPILITLVRGALHGARLTDGAVDPTLGRQLRRIGYDRDILLVADSDEPVAAAPRSPRSWQHIGIDDDRGLLTVPAGCALDLGATAKAQTADLAAASINRRFGCDVLVEIGGDVAVAGTKRDWQIPVSERAGDGGQQVTLGVGGLATSTTTVRTWRRGGQAMHHIIDPTTATSARGRWRTATVAADSALLANVCSTAAIVKADAAVRLLRELPVAARLVDQAGAVTTLGDWPR